jgi:hypothetical protein
MPWSDHEISIDPKRLENVREFMEDATYINPFRQDLQGLNKLLTHRVEANAIIYTSFRTHAFQGILFDDLYGLSIEELIYKQQPPSGLEFLHTGKSTTGSRVTDYKRINTDELTKMRNGVPLSAAI